MSELVNRLDGQLNPILVKELRQSVKGRVTVIIMNLALVILFGAILISQGNIDEMSDQAGLMIFSVISSVLALVCYLIIPLIMYGRTANERNPEEPDLMYITNMTPRQIVLGKYATGLSLLLFYICMCLPFMAFSYIFKGIDLITILFSVGSLLAASFTIVQLAIMLGAIPMKKGIGSRVIGLGIVLLFLGRGVYPVIYYATGYSSVASVSPVLMSGKAILGILLFISMFTIPIYLLNIAMLRPASTNRSMVIRIYLSCLWPLLLAVIYFESSMVGSWLAYYLLVTLLALLISLAGRDELGIRLRRLIPQSVLRRNIAFLLYGGSAGGVLWSLLLAGATLGTVCLSEDMQRISGITDTAMLGILSTASMIIGYSMLAWLISHKFFPTRNGAIVPVFAFVIMMVSSVIVAIAQEMMREFPNVLLYISPRGGMIDFQPEMIFTSVGFMVLTLFFIVPGIVKQYKAFKPVEGNLNNPT